MVKHISRPETKLCPEAWSMSEPTEKLQVAAELLDRGLRMYYEGDSYFAALHLAGAAEELLGTYVERCGGESMFKSLQRGAVKLSKLFDGGVEAKSKDIANVMNHARNRIKHMDSANDDHVHFDPMIEAHRLLDRAVSNYYALMALYELPETELVRRFNLGLSGRANPIR